MAIIKVSIAEILAILKQFQQATSKDIQKSIQYVKVTHPYEQTTLVSFRFYKKVFYIIFDQKADDDEQDIKNVIASQYPMPNGHLVANPKSERTYGLPFKGKDVYLFEITAEKQRLDIELTARYPETSRSTLQKHIKAGHVAVNGEVQTSNKFDVTPIDTIAMTKPALTDHSATDLPILYLDDNVIVVDKPVGVLTHAKGALQDEFTVADFFARYSSYNAESNRPGIVHRLDRDTSGIIIGARNEETATMLQKQFANRKTKKTYYAIVEGSPKASEAFIDLPIGRNPSAPSTFRVDSKGKSAQTIYHVLATDGKHSLVKLEPITGRTHQLRVHMAYLNTPILGDKVYGRVADRLYLHAASLEVTVPISDRKIFTSEVPAEFRKFFPKVAL